MEFHFLPQNLRLFKVSHFVPSIKYEDQLISLDILKSEYLMPVLIQLRNTEITRRGTKYAAMVYQQMPGDNSTRLLAQCSLQRILLEGYV